MSKAGDAGASPVSDILNVISCVVFFWIANEIVPMFPFYIPELQDSWNTITPRGGDLSCKAGEAGGVENTRLGVPTSSSFGLGVM